MWPLRKKLTAAFAPVALALAAPHAGGGARACEGRQQQCPRVVVRCPDRTSVGRAVTYSARIEGLEGNVSPVYKWTTSAGKISSGQGTSEINVDMAGLSALHLAATVEVEGLPEGCPKVASCASTVSCVYLLATKYDEYLNLALPDEKARLDNFAAELLKEPSAQGYVIAYGGRVGRAGEAQRRADRARDYLVNTRGIDASRIVTVDGGYREELTVQLWIVPSGATPPTAEPSVDPSEVRTTAPGRRRRRGRDDDEE